MNRDKPKDSNTARKTVRDFNDLPPEKRQQLEQMLSQMRSSGALDDKNHDGIPDRFELPLRVAGWVGRLTGNPQLKQRLLQQMQALGVTVQPPTRGERPSRTRTMPSRPEQPKPSRATAHVAPATATRVVQRQLAGQQVAAASAVERSSRELGTDSRLPEFLRKLAIVSAVVIGLYLLVTLPGS